jgi:hypothetical protein
MPHYKCAACKTRLHSAASPADAVNDVCPECGCLLEPVGDLAEIVGFRAIKPLPVGAEAGGPGIDEFLSRRRAIMAEAEPPPET